MNKALHVIVYVFLVLAGAGLYFELQLNAKRSELNDRNRIQEDYLVKIAKTIEKNEADKSASFEIMKDSAPVEAKILDVPDQENILSDYDASLEQITGLDTYSWDSMNVRQQMRTVYVLDGEGKPVMDGSEPLKRGPGTEDELLSKLFESAKAQQSRLNTTRSALTELRGVLEGVVNELNKVKPEAREAKAQVVERDEKIEKLEGEKSALENQITKIKAQVEERDAEITSLKDEVNTAQEETETVKEELAKQTKLVEQLKEALQKTIQTGGGAKSVGGVAVSALPAGDKGKIIKIDNENAFAIIEFTAEAMKELKGEDGQGALPLMELGIRRPGYAGEAGEFVGRIRLRQEVKGKPFVICDILSAWEQTPAKTGDVIFAD